MGTVGQGVQPAGPIAAQPAVDGLAADAVALGDLDHREPVAQDLHDGVEALLCHCELQEHTPDLLTSPLVGEAQEGRAVVSTINRNSGTHQPESTDQASTGSAQIHARGLMPHHLIDDPGGDAGVFQPGREGVAEVVGAVQVDRLQWGMLGGWPEYPPLRPGSMAAALAAASSARRRQWWPLGRSGPGWRTGGGEGPWPRSAPDPAGLPQPPNYRRSGKRRLQAEQAGRTLQCRREGADPLGRTCRDPRMAHTQGAG